MSESATSAELIVIPANSKLQKNADESFPFRQDSSFWYFTGLDIAEALLVIDVRDHKQYLILPYRDKHRDQWESSISSQDIFNISGIKNVFSIRDGLKILRGRISDAKKVHTLLAPTTRFKSIYGIQPNPARSIWINRIRRMRPNIEIMSIRDEIKNLRIIKQAPELAAIKKAIEITEAGLGDVHSMLHKCKYEYEVRAVLHAGFQSRGASLAFDSVVAAGSNAALVHYEKSTGVLNKNEMLLIDTGASVEYYAADITRMFMPIEGLSSRQSAVHEAVAGAHKFASDLMKPGLKHREYENQVREYIGEELVKLKLLKRPTKQGVHKYFPSLTSHHLGLDVHDIANYDEEFEEGMVLTIEPGIYIQEEGIGVRIEDDVLITKSGIKVLSEKLYT